jgi:hypothetical protein
MKCKRRGKETPSAHCCDCGTKITTQQEFLPVKKVDIWRIEDAIKERLTTDDFDPDSLVDIWVPNVKYGVDQIDVETLEGAVPLAGDHLNEVDLFTKAFRAELDILEAAYGKDKVAVQWGIVGHYS